MYICIIVLYIVLYVSYFIFFNNIFCYSGNKCQICVVVSSKKIELKNIISHQDHICEIIKTIIYKYTYVYIVNYNKSDTIINLGDEMQCRTTS